MLAIECIVIDILNVGCIPHRDVAAEQRVAFANEKNGRFRRDRGRGEERTLSHRASANSMHRSITQNRRRWRPTEPYETKFALVEPKKQAKTKLTFDSNCVRRFLRHRDARF